MATDLVSAIDRFVAALPNDALTHLLSSTVFEIARRDNETPRAILEGAFQVAPTDEMYREFLRQP